MNNKKVFDICFDEEDRRKFLNLKLTYDEAYAYLKSLKPGHEALDDFSEGTVAIVELIKPDIYVYIHWEFCQEFFNK